MQETDKSSSSERLTVEQLLQLKRLETPNPEFWERFERDLKQKQLQTLMRPSLWGRARAAFFVPKWALLAPLSAATVVCLALGLVLFSFQERGASGGFDVVVVSESAELGAEKDFVAQGDLAEQDGIMVVARETAFPSPRRSSARFVEDVLKPAEPGPLAHESFRTVAETKTFIGSSDSSAYYVVNAFTASPGGLIDRGATYEF